MDEMEEKKTSGYSWSINCLPFHNSRIENANVGSRGDGFCQRQNPAQRSNISMNLKRVRLLDSYICGAVGVISFDIYQNRK